MKTERTATWASKMSALLNDATFSIEEINDVLELIKNREIPDVQFSDNECELWSLIKRKLDIHY